MLTIKAHIWMDDGRMFYDVGDKILVQGDMLFEHVWGMLHNKDEWGGLIDAHAIVNGALLDYWAGAC